MEASAKLDEEIAEFKAKIEKIDNDRTEHEETMKLYDQTLKTVMDGINNLTEKVISFISK